MGTIIMAQEVGYMDNNVTYTEGPFVIVYVNGWRIEAELKGHKCPVLPDVSIYHLAAMSERPLHKTENKSEIEMLCNWLNREADSKYPNSHIKLEGNAWIAPGY
jgi:hypothetical protein